MEINDIVDGLMQDILENVISNFDATQSPNTYILTRVQRDQLITCKYANIVTETKDIITVKNDFCPMFQNKFSNNDNVTIMPCGHCFNTEPLMHWLETKRAECPLCKYNFPIDITISRIREVVDEEIDMRDAINQSFN